MLTFKELKEAIAQVEKLEGFNEEMPVVFKAEMEFPMVISLTAPISCISVRDSSEGKIYMSLECNSDDVTKAVAAEALSRTVSELMPKIMSEVGDSRRRNKTDASTPNDSPTTSDLKH